MLTSVLLHETIHAKLRTPLLLSNFTQQIITGMKVSFEYCFCRETGERTPYDEVERACIFGAGCTDSTAISTVVKLIYIRPHRRLAAGPGKGFCFRVDECGRKMDDRKCKIGQIRTTSCRENFKINLDFFSLKQGLKQASLFSQVNRYVVQNPLHSTSHSGLNTLGA